MKVVFFGGGSVAPLFHVSLSEDLYFMEQNLESAKKKYFPFFSNYALFY